VPRRVVRAATRFGAAAGLTLPDLVTDDDCRAECEAEPYPETPYSLTWTVRPRFEGDAGREPAVDRVRHVPRHDKKCWWLRA